MGVVRRMGDWRLEKRDEGVYEITFRNEPQRRDLTPDAPPYERNAPLFDSVPVEHVRSYSEVEGLFEERAHGPPPLGMAYSSDESRRSATTKEEVPWTELPTGLLGVVLLALSITFLYVFIGSRNAIGLTIGVVLGIAGLIPFLYAGYVSRNVGWGEGVAVLRTPLEELISEGASKRTERGADAAMKEEPAKTPPPPQKLKNELFFDRANRQCEYCEKPFDQLHIHHIKPRREGGPNTRKNLIVLCPNCHSKADSGAISRSKLRYKVKEQLAVSQD